MGVMKKAAAVSFEYIFVETANPATVIAKLSQQEVPGSQVMDTITMSDYVSPNRMLKVERC